MSEIRNVILVTAALAISVTTCTSEDEETNAFILNGVTDREMISQGAASPVIFPPFNTTDERDRFTEAIKLKLNPHPGGFDLDETVFVQVTIDSSGAITHTRAFSSVNKTASQEAIRAVESTRFTFKPLIENGNTVESMVVVPVVFGNGSEFGSCLDLYN